MGLIDNTHIFRWIIYIFYTRQAKRGKQKKTVKTNHLSPAGTKTNSQSFSCSRKIKRKSWKAAKKRMNIVSRTSPFLPSVEIFKILSMHFHPTCVFPLSVISRERNEILNILTVNLREENQLKRRSGNDMKCKFSIVDCETSLVLWSFRGSF